MNRNERRHIKSRYDSLLDFNTRRVLWFIISISSVFLRIPKNLTCHWRPHSCLGEMKWNKLQSKFCCHLGLRKSIPWSVLIMEKSKRWKMKYIWLNFRGSVQFKEPEIILHLFWVIICGNQDMDSLFRSYNLM